MKKQSKFKIRKEFQLFKMDKDWFCDYQKTKIKTLKLNIYTTILTTICMQAYTGALSLQPTKYAGTLETNNSLTWAHN